MSHAHCSEDWILRPRFWSLRLSRLSSGGHTVRLRCFRHGCVEALDGVITQNMLGVRTVTVLKHASWAGQNDLHS